MLKRSMSIAVASIIAVATAQAETVTVSQLTDNTVHDTGFWLNNVGDVAWTSYEAGDSEVYLYDGDSQTTIAVTTNDIDDNGIQVNNQGDAIWIQYEPNPDSPSIGATFKKIMHRSVLDGSITEIARSDYNILSLQFNDNGDIAWLGYEEIGPSDVYKYDAATGTVTNLTTDLEGYAYNPRMNGQGDVVWLGYETIVGDDGDIYLYSNASGSVNNISNSEVFDSSWYLTINNNGDVAWAGNDGAESHIFRYDGTTNITQQLTVANGAYDTNQWMNALGDVVWNSDSNIVLYKADTQTITQLTNDTLYRSNAVLDSNGNIVWQGAESATATDTDMFIYDPSDGSISNISNNDVNDYFYWMNNHGDVAWTSGEGTAAEIMFFSQTTKAVTQITNDTIEDGVVAMNDNLDIVWTRNDGDLEIMLANIQTTEVLDFTYSRATIDLRDGDIKIRLNSELSLPAASDQITVSLDGVNVLDVTFADFVADDDPGEYEYETNTVEAELDIVKGTFDIEIDGVIANTLDTSDGVYLEISIGNAVGEGQIELTPVNDGRDRRHRDRDRDHGDYYDYDDGHDHD